MNKIITLTMNPVVEKATSVAGVIPNKKLRCGSPHYSAGGGGINVSRAIQNLGGSSLCMYVAGGPAGTHLQQLLSNNLIEQKVISIKGWTRENLFVTDTNTNLQYRFGIPGPNVKEEEWREVLKHVDDTIRKGDYLVASGKLPLGVPTNFYVQVSDIVHRKEGRLVLDTSGKALLPSMKSDIFLMKPNLSELSELCGVESISILELERLSKNILKKYPVKILVVSMGAKGAFLATKETNKYIAAPTVHQKSTIGSGDSMVAGMVLGLSQGKALSEMFQYGVACGTAATIHPGTQLCKKEDADKLYEWLLAENVKKNKNITELT